MYMMQAVINALYALYGEPEPTGDTRAEDIKEKLNKMAEQRREDDIVRESEERIREADEERQADIDRWER